MKINWSDYKDTSLSKQIAYNIILDTAYEMYIALYITTLNYTIIIDFIITILSVILSVCTQNFTYLIIGICTLVLITVGNTLLIKRLRKKYSDWSDYDVLTVLQTLDVLEMHVKVNLMEKLRKYKGDTDDYE